MGEATPSLSTERPFTRSQSQLAGRLTMTPSPDSGKDSSKKETDRTSNRKPKPPPLRSQPAPIIRSAFAAANFGQRNSTNSPVLRSLPKPLPKTLTSQQITESQSKTRSGRTIPRPSPDSRRTKTSKPLEQRNTSLESRNEQSSTTVNAHFSTRPGNNVSHVSRSTASPQTSDRPVYAGRGTGLSVHNLLAEAKAAKERKAKNRLAQNTVEQARGKMLPLPIGNPSPLRKRQVKRRPGTALDRNFTRKSPIRKPITRKTADVMITPETKPQPTTRPRTRIQPLQNTNSGRHRPAGQKRRISQSAEASTRSFSSSRQYRTRSRRRISYSSEEYGSESLQPGRQEQIPPMRSKVPATHYNLPSQSKFANESDSNAEVSPPHANKFLTKILSTSSSESSSGSSEEQDSSHSTSEFEESDDGSKFDARPVRGGKSIPEYVLRQMGLSEKEIAKISKEQTQSLPKKNGTHRTVAHKSNAGKPITANTIAFDTTAQVTLTHMRVAPKVASTVAGKTVAGKTIAGKTIAGKTIAGKTVAGKTVAGKIAGKIAGQTVASKTVAGKTVAGKTVAGKTVASKTVAGKSLTGKTLPQPTIPNRRMHAGGIRLDSTPLPQPSDPPKEKLPVSSSIMIPIEENNSSPSLDSDSESYSYDSDDSSELNDEKESQGTKIERCKSTADYEARRKEMRDMCVQQLLARNAEQYSSSVREEFFLEMEYILHLIGKLKNEDDARDQLGGSISYFEQEIAPLRLDGLNSLGCQVEALNYSCWLQLFHIRRLFLQEASDPPWKENFEAVHGVLESAHKSARPGEKVTIQLEDSHLKFLLNHWKVLRNVSDVLAFSPSAPSKLQTREGGCQIQ